MPAPASARVREEVKDWIFLIGKTILVIVGGLLILAALVEISVGGPWFVRGATPIETFEKSAGLVLLAGLLLAVPPMALAFRDAVREARKGRL